MCTRARKLCLAIYLNTIGCSLFTCERTKGAFGVWVFVREPRVHLGFGFMWECLQIIVVISTVIVKIYSVASRGCRHIAEPRKFLMSYYLLSLSSLTLCKQIYFTQYAQHNLVSGYQHLTPTVKGSTHILTYNPMNGLTHISDQF